MGYIGLPFAWELLWQNLRKILKTKSVTEDEKRESKKDTIEQKKDKFW